MDEMVTIRKDGFCRLKAIEEDLSDLWSAAKVLERSETGEEELMPGTVVDRLLEGEAPLKVWREHRQMTQAELARQSRVNRIQIIDMESGQKTGSVVTLKKLAAAPDIDLDDIETNLQ